MFLRGRSNLHVDHGVTKVEPIADRFKQHVHSTRQISTLTFGRTLIVQWNRQIDQYRNDRFLSNFLKNL